jgi:hypothetical protein
MNIVFQVLWVAAGMVGYAILRRDPDRFTFDNPLWTILALVAMAALFPVWGGPLFLVLVLALPAKRLCPRCRRTLPKAAATCPHCGQLQDLTPAQAEELARSLAPEREELAVLARQYERWYWVSSLVAFASMVAAGFLWTAALYALAQWRGVLVAGSAHTVVLGPVAWALPSMFLGIATANYLGEPIMLLLLRERYQQYADYQRRKFPVDVQHWANVLFGIVLLLIVPIVLVMQDFYAAALPDALAVHQPLAPSADHYAYTDIMAIQRATRLIEEDGDVRRLDQSAYLVEFAHGRRWWARADLGYYDPPALATLIEYISRQSGVPIRDVDALDSADLK